MQTHYYGPHRSKTSGSREVGVLCIWPGSEVTPQSAEVWEPLVESWLVSFQIAFLGGVGTPWMTGPPERHRCRLIHGAPPTQVLVFIRSLFRMKRPQLPLLPSRFSKHLGGSFIYTLQNSALLTHAKKKCNPGFSVILLTQKVQL